MWANVLRAIGGNNARQAVAIVVFPLAAAVGYMGMKLEESVGPASATTRLSVYEKQELAEQQSKNMFIERSVEFSGMSADARPEGQYDECEGIEQSTHAGRRINYFLR
ncbi:hypothetical protein SARC_08989 [Sphaeroforma arctica JP610]|uniref:Uncharacterized protein n=1 Tax=Sphaeroforma arctica JP610 TaxID=667725 RepID=A0A0L0FP56_9EUKA|nr:hypothetical protein SARC_08989 [Sphaeroforma arctica JP610]KNC78590.1 hypothetical protein SARC_08989 [Sphaeroforma arctica JP610]|eukprot:XP_014152492.1 hypothetical protein SARC_08989 [Sphaeroforma arctica JP610]